MLQLVAKILDEVKIWSACGAKDIARIIYLSNFSWLRFKKKNWTYTDETGPNLAFILPRQNRLLSILHPHSHATVLCHLDKTGTKLEKHSL